MSTTVDQRIWFAILPLVLSQLSCSVVEQAARIRPLDIEVHTRHVALLHAGTPILDQDARSTIEQELTGLLRELNRTANRSALAFALLPDNTWIRSGRYSVRLEQTVDDAASDCERGSVVVSTSFLFSLSRAASSERRSLAKSETQASLSALIERTLTTFLGEDWRSQPELAAVNTTSKAYLDTVAWLLAHELYHLREGCSRSIPAELSADKLAAALLVLHRGGAEIDNRFSGVGSDQTSAESLETSVKNLRDAYVGVLTAESVFLLLNEDLGFRCADGVVSEADRVRVFRTTIVDLQSTLLKWQRLMINPVVRDLYYPEIFDDSG